MRKTGWTIAIVMVVGGVIVAGAYLRKLRADERDNRPKIVGRLTQMFGGLDQNEKGFKTQMLTDKITLLTPIAGREKARTAESLRVMKMVAEKFSGDDSFRFVGLAVDAANDGPEEFRAMLGELGVAEDVRWKFVQAEEKNVIGFLRNKLRIETTETIRLDGEEVKRFRSEIVLIDPNLHVLEPRFDFNLAREAQEEAVQLLEKDPERAEKLNAKEHTEAVKKAEERLLEAIEDIRKGDLKEGKAR